jgi:endonuclease/exonuclease/phosphatase family metal-dependent hydrolase
MRIATFNTCHGSNGRGTPTDQDALNTACVALDADLLALQELDRGRKRSGAVDQAALAALASGASHAFGRAFSPTDGDYGNALLVRGELDDVEELPLLHVTPPWRGRSEPRSALLARVRVDGHVLSVAVVHLSTRPVEAARQLRMVGRVLRSRPGPQLVMGDCNLGIMAVSSVLRPLGLTPVRAGGPTHPRVKPRLRIDHLAAAGLDISAVESVDTGRSDHRALVAEATFPSGAR